jgi:hypothetical protein
MGPPDTEFVEGIRPGDPSILHPHPVRRLHRAPTIGRPRVRRFHHVGIPTQERRPGERHLPEYGMWVSGYDENPYGVEWMRFDADSPIPELVQRVPHVAFQPRVIRRLPQGRRCLRKCRARPA